MFCFYRFLTLHIFKTAVPFRMALMPLLGKPATRDIPEGKLPSEGDFLLLLHGEVEARGGFRGFRGISDLCCTVKSDKCQCEGDDNVGEEGGGEGEGEEGGGGGREAEQGRSAEKKHCKARGQPCLIAIIQKGWKEAALPVKSSSCNLSSLPRETSPM